MGESSIISAYLKNMEIVDSVSDLTNKPKKQLDGKGIMEIKTIAQDSENEMQKLLSKALTIKLDKYKKRGEEMSEQEMQEQTVELLMPYLDPLDQFNLNCYGVINRLSTSGQTVAEVKENLCKACTYFVTTMAPGTAAFNWRPLPEHSK